MTTDVTFADDGERYRLDHRIAAGAMGEVWRGTDLTLGRPVAVKLLRHEYADDATFRARFEAEARNTGALQHPNIAAVYDVGEADGRPFLVMEYVDGQPLSKLLDPGMIARVGPMATEAVRDLLAQAADGLGAAHRAGIVHRDVKPANLMVTRDRKVKITDFGIARAADGLALTGTGMVMGTPAYLSPEQATGQPSTPASDVYALGCVGYECLTGRRAFEAESPVATALAHVREAVPALPASVPADLARVVTRAMAKDPAERYADGDAFAEALRHPPAATAATVVAPTTTQVLPPVTPPAPVTPVPPVVAPPVVEEEPRPRGLGILLAVFVAVVAIVVAVIVWRGIQDKNGDEPADDRPSNSPTPTQTNPTPSTTPSTTPSVTPPATIDLDEGDYLGRDIEDVAPELTKLGLKVNPVPVPNPGGQTAGAVTSVSPRHGLHDGDTVTVEYYDDPSSTPTPSDTPTPSEGASETPTPSDTPSGTPSTTPSDTPSGPDSASPSVTATLPVVPSRIVGTP